MKKIIYWFRNDLRLHDQIILKRIENQKEVVLLPIFCFDERWFAKHTLGFPKTGSIRAKFLIETVNNLKTNLQKIGSDLLVTFGKTEEVLFEVAKRFNANEIYAEKEDTSEEIFVEEALKKRLSIPVHFHESKTLLKTEQLPFSISNLPDIFTHFRKKVEPILDTVQPIEEVEKLPPFPDEFRNEHSFSLQDFGLNEAVFDSRAVMHFTGGECEGLKRLNKFIWQDKSILHYKETRNQLIGENYSSKFSPWLANGSLSARRVFSEIKKFEKEVEANESTYWLVFELLWRDYFRFVAKKYGNKIFLKGGIKNKSLSYNNDFEVFEKWRTGKTGNDFVDANMTELMKTGFMSNRGRQNVASYLCKDLKIDWRWGASWFESQLIDYDVASNWGNWMYIAGVGNDPREARYFNVNKQAAMYDQDTSYRKLWLDSLAKP
ncbi:deoxyribodipyrimidine photo-lyase [Thermonema lapsum]|uniref:Cryptochrome DASH n=1 Tax=Thermonema lapsum TaxID=28195 RepID=A0A846MR74_9BACT|nr:DASH family cryptochrome [Thermonema lapsum]NIK73959.1 deoxyribodipyrimidine photo-lyase [Thermonema lapsum]